MVSAALSEPVSVSLEFEARIADTPPMIVSVPISVPVAVPVNRLTVTEVPELMNETRVLPLPVMTSLPPIPSNSLKLAPSPISRLAPAYPTAV